MTRADESRNGWAGDGQPVDDPLAEALLTGAVVPPELVPLSAVVRALREEALRPVPPSPALAVLMVTGAAGGGRSRPLRSRPLRSLSAPARRPVAVRVRVARIRLVAGMAAAGVAVAVVGVATGGFAGILPEQAQDRFENVVESVTPYEFRHERSGPVRTGPDSDRQPGDLPDGGAGGRPGNGDHGPDLGRADADGPGRGVDGREVSERARQSGGPGNSGQAPETAGVPGSGGVPGPAADLPPAAGTSGRTVPVRDQPPGPSGRWPASRSR